MPVEPKWTREQREAVERVDRSVLVAAGAGSGKTAVLAARCAHLVADAPIAQRVDVDRLLVVTFTEAAAAEMRRRIRDALRARAAENPADRRLERQARLVDAAAISTLHAFCLWLVRRWFHRVGVDAAAQILDEDEARLLRMDALRALFDDRYVATGPGGERFRQLVEDYGLGIDTDIGSFVLRLADFAGSQPDPADWLGKSADFGSKRLEGILADVQTMFATELARQAANAAAAAQHVGQQLPEAMFYGERLGEFAERLANWHERAARANEVDTVRAEILEYRLSSQGAPRKSKTTPPETVAQRESARALFEDARGLFTRRLQDRYAHFTTQELREGVERVAPFVQTLAELAGAFQERYAALKRGLGVMDFSDLERNAYRLLGELLPGETANPVAEEMRARFAHVLVDEYQDINPLQAAILNLVSRAEPPGNLFTVGDVKQSIYRFRLAEPAMFLERGTRLRTRDERSCIDLQTNFRSKPALLDAVNLVFSRLMQADCGGIAYDEHAALRPPAGAVDGGDRVEVHLLEAEVMAVAAEEEEPVAQPNAEGDATDYVDPADPTQWRRIEREAFFVARHIRDLIASGVRVRDGSEERPATYRDVAILLRSTRFSAAVFANMLAQLDVPVWTDAAGSLFGAREVREVLALLAVLDNTQQDIPLAAVLRSGILGDPFSADELVEIRTLDRQAAYHEVVRRYAVEGKAPPLREKLATLLRRLDTFRVALRTRPLADALWSIYRETGYFAYIGGLPQGERRQANLIALHQRARQFGQFRRQGLRRFLQFIETLQDQDEDLGAPAAFGDADNAVRILSIHKSKGLEFPIVYLAEMGRNFNLSDARGRFLFDRRNGVGIKAVDRDKLIEYPTALHLRCQQAVHEASLAEELRIAYVAMTRARDRLIMVGSGDPQRIEARRALAAQHTERVPVLDILTACAPLDWLLAALGGAPPGSVAWNAGPVGASTRFAVQLHDAAAIREWRPSAGAAAEDSKAHLQVVAALAPLPVEEPLSDDRSEAGAVLSRLDYTYAHLGASSIRATRAASEPKRRFDPGVDETDAVSVVARPRAAVGAADGDDIAKRRGQTVHTALEFIHVTAATSAAAVNAELDRLVAAGTIRAEDRPLVDAEALAWFFDTELGRRIRAAPDAYRREWMFVAAAPAAMFDTGVATADADRVLVRGVVDGILAAPNAVELLDFKTDRTPPDAVMVRAAAYRMQLELYSTAVAEVFRRPVQAAHLVFLHPRRIVELREIQL
jgi:ATP-dependent helicase/nuclease subunit A